jgi:hypothetical protein
LLFNSLLSEEQFSKLAGTPITMSLLTLYVAIIMTGLVDSNMFLRAALLSVEYFRADKTSTSPAYNFEDCKIVKFIEKQRDQILIDLFTTITIQDIAQESILTLTSQLVDSTRYLLLEYWPNISNI